MTIWPRIILWLVVILATLIVVDRVAVISYNNGYANGQADQSILGE